MGNIIYGEYANIPGINGSTMVYSILTVETWSLKLHKLKGSVDRKTTRNGSIWGDSYLFPRWYLVMGENVSTQKLFLGIHKLPAITRCSWIHHGSCSASKCELLPQPPLRYPFQYLQRTCTRRSTRGTKHPHSKHKLRRCPYSPFTSLSTSAWWSRGLVQTEEKTLGLVKLSKGEFSIQIQPSSNFGWAIRTQKMSAWLGSDSATAKWAASTSKASR